MIVVDLFAGGGGASEGIRRALGVGPKVAINHDVKAIQMHAANHPGTLHLCEDLLKVRPFKPGRRTIDLLWGSPDCGHHSRAKGGKPLDNKRRMLAWVVLEWAREVAPRVIVVENVPEFLNWGPLDEHDRPIKARLGETYREWVHGLQLAGYRIEWRTLVAADYGAPTIRKRWYLVARCDGQPIQWPEPTHGPGRALPWRTAAECIDWSIPVPSIFERTRPLAEATQRRIAKGIVRYVLQAPRPFIVPICHTVDDRVHDSAEPLRTVTTAKGGEFALVSPTIIQTGYGEREGQAPRVLDLDRPLGTVVAGGQKHALVAAFLAKHYGGVVGHAVNRPLGTVTTVDHHSVVAAHLTQFWGSARAGRGLGEPAPTVLSGGGRGGGHAGLVAAFLTKFYGSGGQLQACDDPLHTIPTVDRFGLVTVHIDGEPWILADIGLRMLEPRELARAQGFQDSYLLTGTKRDQVARIGNSVCPPVAAAIVAAQFGVDPQQIEVAA